MYKQTSLDFDTKAKMRGRVVNKRARYNLCFADFNQELDYEEGKGRVIDFSDVPILNNLRDEIEDIAVVDLVAESNYYYDINKCYIGFHGDTERSITIGIRLGYDWPLHYQWYQNSKRIDDMFTITLEHGDIYFMSDKATGNDWKKRLIPTLRHAAGTNKVRWKL